MAKYRGRIAKLEQRTCASECLVLIRGDDETDEAAWRRYLTGKGLSLSTPIPSRRVVFIAESDALL
jgi:hypothetical protein